MSDATVARNSSRVSTRAQRRAERLSASVSQRSRRTNDLFVMPPGNWDQRPHSSDARRWRDLMRHYHALLGERIKEEHIRVCVTQLCTLTMLVERKNAEIASGADVSAQDMTHLTQVAYAIVRLQDELGLKRDVQHGKLPGDLRDYANRLREQGAGECDLS